MRKVRKGRYITLTKFHYLHKYLKNVPLKITKNSLKYGWFEVTLTIQQMQGLLTAYYGEDRDSNWFEIAHKLEFTHGFSKDWELVPQGNLTIALYEE